MFLNEKPIEKIEDDKLGRSNFSTHLAKSILEWHGSDSLVISLNGKWGSGKSSVINLAKLTLKNSPQDSAPTIIEFNPWIFSGEEKLNEHFFNEISKELEFKTSSDDDKKIANNLRLYSELLSLIPNHSQISSTIKDIFIIAAIIGITAQQFLEHFNFISKPINIAFFIVCFLFLSLSLVNTFIKKVAEIFDKRSVAKSNTVLAFKEEIKQYLKKRKKKILIIIDDIDRLTPEEVRILFKLIKINSDFPNVIYLLSFDREVVKNALAVQGGVNGQDYLEKIIQVNFDIPLAKQEKVTEILINECNIILEKLPKSSEKLFNETYWNTIYNAGLKNLFRNIRDVKRFASSLELNFSFLHKGNSMEVNPIDFIAIEAIRIFAPEFYSFMRNKKSLFTNSEENKRDVSESRKKDIEDGLGKIEEYLRADIKGLISSLFPQTAKLFSASKSLYGGYYSLEEATKALKVSSPHFFDAYFTLIPGGDETELNQFELDYFISVLNNKRELESQVKKYVENNKINKLLERLENYTRDFTHIPEDNISNFVETFFSLSDDLPTNRSNSWGFSLQIQFERVIFQLFERTKSKEKNSKILKGAVSSSNALFGPVNMVSVLSSQGGSFDVSLYIPPDTLTDIQKVCADKIIAEANKGTLITNKHFAYILFRWKEWSGNDKLDSYVQSITKTNDGLVVMLEHFITIMNTHTMQGTIRQEYFGYANLDHFISSDEVKIRLEKIKTEELGLYKKNKKLIDMFLNNFRIDPFNR